MIEQGQFAAGQSALNALLAGQILDGSNFDPDLFVRPGISQITLQSPEDAVIYVEGATPGDVVPHFRARLEVAGLMSPWPEMNLTILSAEENRLIVEGKQAYPWPHFKVELELDAARKPKSVRGVHLDPADRTADAEILYTRLIYALMGDGLFRIIDLEHGRELKLRIHAQGEDEDWIYLRSKLARKLKFIEEAFGVRFRLPEDARRGDVNRIEMIFRCLTEGRYRQRQDTYTLSDSGYAPSADELTRPPFSGPGPINFGFPQTLAVYNQSLDETLALVHLECAEVFDLDDLAGTVTAGKEPREVSFLLLDHQILYRFPEYEPLVGHFNELLTEFRGRLLAEEPAELADLLSAPVEKPVTDEEARQIVVGWLQYNKFPDGFWPQEPVLEGERWRVPVWIAYPGLGAPVEDLLVDRVTGEVESPVPARELLEMGGSVAEALLRAS
jgi:hypothetical protein